LKLVRRFEKIPLTGVGGGAMGGFLFPFANLAIDGRFENFDSIFYAVLDSLLLIVPACVIAFPHTLLGVLILFYPSCKFFGKRRKIDLALICAIGSLLGFSMMKLYQYFDLMNFFYMDNDFSTPWVGPLFGMTTGFIGWSLMEAKETERYDG
jgi:hypothetical protein